MEALRQTVARVAPSTLPVLITGETGAGKELVAEQVHRASDRRTRRLVRLNCAAIAESLVEAELFGHARGAFTGADAPRAGLIDVADGGTLLLDEVGELPLAVQAKLLRVLEDGQVRPVGATEAHAVDVRLVCATHRALGDDVAAGRFRQDLYFRLAGVTLVVPPLRERRDEIEPLARAFAAHVRTGPRPAPVLSVAAIAALRAAPWPGNVRQLRNTIERAALVAAGGEIEPHDLGLDAARGEVTIELPAPPGRAVDAAARRLADTVADAEREHILDALARCGGNQTHAARLLGISRNTLLARLDRFGVSRPRRK
jgi:DNA-binding NtrC family response regulator